MAPETGYPIAEAAADLKAAGLLSGVLRAGPDGLSFASGSGSMALQGAFLGAALDSRRLGVDGTDPKRLFVALAGERVDGRDFIPAALAAENWSLTRVWDGAGADPLEGIAVDTAAGVLLSRDPAAGMAVLAGRWRRSRHPLLVGVTGSNGKTTTKDLLAAALRGMGPTGATGGNLNNRLGVPLTLLDLRREHRFAVVEMGASAIGDIEHLAALARPRVGVITNAAPAHLAEFGSLDGVIEGKGELLAALPDDGAAIVNADSPGFERWCERSPCRVVSFGRAAGDHRWSWRPAGPDGRPELTLDGESWPVPLPGEHNGANLAAAVLAARAVGLGDTAIRSGLDGFAGSPHRGVVLNVAGRTVLDDSYNANPGSMVAAARALSGLPGRGRAVAVLGHMAELGDDAAAIHVATGADLHTAGIETLVVVGDPARGLGEGFDAAGGAVHYCASREEAAALLARLTSPQDRLLIKGSRSAGMELLLPLLSAVLATD